jgi:hypothetical protein
MAETVRATPPAAVLELNRETAVFGAALPRRGLLDSVFVEIDRRFVAAGELGSKGPPPRLPGRHASRGVLLLPHDGAKP